MATENRYTDSHRVSVKGQYGPTQYWIRTWAHGSAVMSTIIRYDAFDYRADGLVKVTGSVMPSGTRLGTVEECEKVLDRRLRGKELLK